MMKMSERCIRLREEAVNKKSYTNKYCLQRAVYFSLGAAKAAEKSSDMAEIYGAGIANVIDKFTPFIAPDELITGFNFGNKNLAPADVDCDIALTYGDCYIARNTVHDRELMRENSISDTDIDEYFKIDGFYRDEWYLYGVALWNDKFELTETENAARKDMSALGKCISHNHSVVGYDKVLTFGFEGLLKEVEAYEEKNGASAFYSGIKTVCKSALHIGEKYAESAEELLNTKNTAYNPEDLKTIIATCRRVPRYPARSFIEAVQSLWFAHIINTWEDTINANSLGRLDQLLYPYYKKDMDKGIITEEQAFEIICCLWIKLYRDYDVQQSCVGGTNIDGTSAVNELSYFMLDATEQLDFIRCLSVRYSGNTDKRFIKRALQVVGHVQKGVPFFFNDDVMIPALISKGIKREDAYDYTQLGCVETVIPGKTNPHAVTGETNLLKAIEYVLCNGHSMYYPDIAPGVKTGDLSDFNTYDCFYSAVKKQIKTILELTCSMVVKYCDACVAPKPVKSLLTDGCLEKARDYNQKGALYDYYQIMLGGIPNLADSLMVIKKFVYQDKKYSLEEVKTILENNYPDDSVRLEFLNKAPKFGNDIDEVDSIAVDITNYCCDLLDKLSVETSHCFHAQPFTFFWMIDHGRVSAASPDGRKSGEPIAYSASPMQGRDINGLTAVLNSIAKFPTKRTPGTTSAIVEIDPKLFADKNIDIITDIVIAAAKNGLSNLQLNTIDAKTLENAKKYPEKYNNLAVRVSGFSQKFNLLTPELQDHIIARTKHACL